MTHELFFRAATGVILLIALSISVYFRRRAQLKGGQLRPHDSTARTRLLRLLGLAMWLPVLGYIFFPDAVAWARFRVPEGLRLIGVAVGLLSIFLLGWMFSALGLNISPVEAVREGATLVTSGPYRWIRHPLYTFGFTLMFALTLIAGLWWIVLMAVPIFIFLVRRTPREEANLIAAFGDAYRDYMQRTGRYLPRWNGRAEPTTSRRGPTCR